MSKKEAAKYVAIAVAQKKALKASAAQLQKQAIKKANKTKLPFIAKTDPKVKAGLAFNFITNVALLSAVAVVVVRAFKKDPELKDKVQKKVEKVTRKVKKDVEKAVENTKENIEAVDASAPAPAKVTRTTVKK